MISKAIASDADPPPIKPPGKLSGMLGQMLRNTLDGLKFWRYNMRDWSAYTVGNNVSDLKWLGILYVIHGKAAPAILAAVMEKVCLATKVFLMTTIGVIANSN